MPATLKFVPFASVTQIRVHHNHDRWHYHVDSPSSFSVFFGPCQLCKRTCISTLILSFIIRFYATKKNVYYVITDADGLPLGVTSSFMYCFFDLYKQENYTYPSLFLRHEKECTLYINRRRKVEALGC